MSNDLKHVGILGMKWGRRKRIAGNDHIFKKRTEPKYDKNGNDISKNPFKRIGKEKFQSDKDFDKVYNAEMKRMGKEIKAENAAKVKKALDTMKKNRMASEELASKSYSFRQLKFVHEKMGGNPNDSPAAIWTKNLVAQLVVLGVGIALLEKYG